MTYIEFRNKVPYKIKHEVWGIAELEMIKFGKGDDRVGVFYRSEPHKSSYGTIASNWDDIYDQLVPILKRDGHIK